MSDVYFGTKRVNGSMVRLYSDRVDAKPIMIESLAKLQEKYPTGAKGFYYAIDNGHFYGWNETEWQDLGEYSHDDLKTLTETNGDVNPSIDVKNNYITGLTNASLHIIEINVPSEFAFGCYSCISFVTSANAPSIILNPPRYRDLIIIDRGKIIDTLNLKANARYDLYFECDALDNILLTYAEVV